MRTFALCVAGFLYVQMNLVTVLLSLISSARSLEDEKSLPRDFLYAQMGFAVLALLLSVGLPLVIHAQSEEA